MVRHLEDIALKGIPELLEDGSEISDVDNEQAAGLQLIGYDLYAKIKKGTVSFPESDAEAGEEDLLPVFDITVAAYTKDADGNVAHDFGSVKERFTALEYGKDNYTLDDINGVKKSYYLGDWVMFAHDVFEDGAEFEYDVTIEDAGEDEDGEAVLKITNLSGANGTLGMVDEVYATWDSSYGVLWLYGQDLETPISYGGEEYTVGLYPYDPDEDTIYKQSNCLVGGVTDEGVLAFVNLYTDANMAGFAWYIPDLGGALAINYYMYGYPASSSSVGKVSFNQYEKLARKAQVSGRGVKSAVKKLGGARHMVKKTQSQPVFRTVNPNHFVKAEKNLGTLMDVRMK